MKLIVVLFSIQFLSRYVSGLECNGQNEKYQEWISACPDTCPKTGTIAVTDAPPLPSKCRAIVHKPSCVCTNGTIRDTLNNRCVTPDKCPQIPYSNGIELKCEGENERLIKSNGCQPSCQFNCIRSVVREPSSKLICACLPGTMRDIVTKKCVHFKDCPKKITHG